MTLLISGVSGSGKSEFCKRLLCYLSAEYFNNDSVRERTKNFDWSMNGRLLAAQNMRKFLDHSSAEFKLVDMICPTKELRKIIRPDVIVFIDSNRPTKYEDTAAIYEIPTKDECRALFVAKFDQHQKTVDKLINYLAANPQN